MRQLRAKQGGRSEADAGLTYGSVHDPIRELLVVEGSADGVPRRRLVRL